MSLKIINGVQFSSRSDIFVIKSAPASQDYLQIAKDLLDALKTQKSVVPSLVP